MDIAMVIVTVMVMATHMVDASHAAHTLMIAAQDATTQWSPHTEHAAFLTELAAMTTAAAQDGIPTTNDIPTQLRL